MRLNERGLSVFQDELSEGVSSLGVVNTKVQALIDQLEETCRIIEVCVEVCVCGRERIQKTFFF